MGNAAQWSEVRSSMIDLFSRVLLDLCIQFCNSLLSRTLVRSLRIDEKRLNAHASSAFRRLMRQIYKWRCGCKMRLG